MILAGETHIKGSTAQSNGQNLLKHFNYRGLEGADSKSSLAAKIVTPLMDTMGTIAKKVFRLKGSTITDAAIEGTLEDYSRGLAQQVAAAILEEKKVARYDLTDADKDKLRIGPAAFQISANGVPMDMERLLSKSFYWLVVAITLCWVLGRSTFRWRTVMPNFREN